ncbi:MAG: hypothetical protein HEQ23_05865 [Tepidisphaera sp.]
MSESEAAYDEAAFTEKAARNAILSSWLRAAAVSLLLVLFLYGCASVARGDLIVLWVALAGPFCAVAYARMLDLRSQWHPTTRYWLVIAPAFTHPIWATLLTIAVEITGLAGVFGASNPLQLGAAVTVGVLSLTFALAERSFVPFATLAGAAVLCILPSAFGARVTSSRGVMMAALACLVPLATLALMNQLHIRRRIRRPGRCERCQYLAVGLSRCPECGGKIAPLDGPVEHDARFD